MQWIVPSWDAPQNINALMTTRNMLGVSQPPYEQFNVAFHVEDNPDHVNANRQLLTHQFDLPSSPHWLNQTHSNVVYQPSKTDNTDTPSADASFTTVPGQVLAVMTADCLPILLTNQSGTAIAAIHAGWRGVLNGVIENTLPYFEKDEHLMAWLGAAIGPQHFYVGQEVYEDFAIAKPQCLKAFRPQTETQYVLDLAVAATCLLSEHKNMTVFQSHLCTYQDPERFYSYRRDGVTGRMVSLIWIS